MAESSPNGSKTLGKEKSLVMSNFCFSQSVFKRLVQQTRKKTRGLFGKGLTHYQTTNFRLFQTKKIADDNSKFDENGRKLSKWVGNTVGNRKITRYEQFLLFQQCFQKACFPGALKGFVVWEWVKAFSNWTSVAFCHHLDVLQLFRILIHPFSSCVDGDQIHQK